MTIIQTIKRYFSIFIKHFPPIGLFVLLPMVITLYLGNSIISDEKNKHIQELSIILENTLKDIESEVAPESFLLKVARGAWFTLKKEKDNLNNFWNYYEKLCSFIDSKPDIYLFDEKGNMITPNKFSLKSKFLATKLWNTIDSNYEERVNLFNKYKKEFKNFLGNEFKLSAFLEARNKLLPIIVKTNFIT